MKVLVTLEYEATGDIDAAVASLRDAYRHYQGRTESISNGGEFFVKCVSDLPTIVVGDDQ